MGLYESIVPFLFIQSDTNGCIDAQRDSLRNFSFRVPKDLFGSLSIRYLGTLHNRTI